MKFIKLTSTLDKVVYVNSDFIVMIGNKRENNTEFSVLNSTDTYHVKETPEEILKLIQEAK